MAFLITKNNKAMSKTIVHKKKDGTKVELTYQPLGRIFGYNVWHCRMWMDENNRKIYNNNGLLGFADGSGKTKFEAYRAAETSLLLHQMLYG
jgi:hypothetical protein